MSWDIYVQDIPKGVKSTDEIPADFRPRPLGSRRKLVEGIRGVVPAADFSNPSLGSIEGPGFSIEISLGEEEEVESFSFHVHGGDSAAFVVADILRHLGLQAFDPSSDTGIFAAGPDGAPGQKKWRAYRDRVLAKGK